MISLIFSLILFCTYVITINEVYENFILKKNKHFRIIIFTTICFTALVSIISIDKINNSFIAPNPLSLLAIIAAIVYTPVLYFIYNRLNRMLTSKNLIINILIIFIAVALSVLTINRVPFFQQPEENKFWLKFALLSLGFLITCFIALEIKKKYIKKLDLNLVNIDPIFLGPIVLHCIVGFLASIFLIMDERFSYINNTSNGLGGLSFIAILSSYLTINSVIIFIPLVLSSFLELIKLNVAPIKALPLIVVNAAIFLFFIQYYGWWVGITLGNFYPWVIRF